MRPRLIVLLASFIVAVAACGGGSTPTSATAPASTLTPTAAGALGPAGGATSPAGGATSPASGATLDPCAALTTDEVVAAFVDRWGGPWTATPGHGDAINCAYEVTSPESGSDTVLVTKLDQFSWPHFQEADGTDAVPVAGLGDTAWTAGGNVQVKAGALWFRIETHDLLAPQLTALARDVIAHAGG
jgi:hypothetical protein